MKPYKCPICDGRGIVPAGFYQVTFHGYGFTSTSSSHEICRSCGGSGIIWGKEGGELEFKLGERGSE